MGYLYKACDQISDFCHQQLLRIMRLKWAYTKCMFNVYKNQLSRQTGSRNLKGPKTLPTIWYTYMILCDEGECCEAAPISPSDFFWILHCLHRLSLFIFVQQQYFILCLVNIVLNLHKILEHFCGTELFIFHLDFIVCNQP